MVYKACLTGALLNSAIWKQFRSNLQAIGSFKPFVYPVEKEQFLQQAVAKFESPSERRSSCTDDKGGKSATASGKNRIPRHRACPVQKRSKLNWAEKTVGWI